MEGGLPDVIKLHDRYAMILTAPKSHDPLADLERDAQQQSPITIELRRQLAEVSQLMDTARLAELNVHLKRQGAWSHCPIRREGGRTNGR